MTAALASDFSTPESAIRSLEAAYAAKDLGAAVAAKDFAAEARLMLQKINPQYASDAELLKKTAEVLELSFRQQMRTKGFPDLKGVRCDFTAKTQVSANLVRLTERCRYPDGGESKEDVHVWKGASGWRQVSVPR
jgi:hypothetical protein